MSEIDVFIDRLKAKGLELTKECDYSTFLGIMFHRNLKNNNITMTQPGLFKKNVEATGMTLCSPNKTPTSQTALGSEPEGPPIKENWKYSSMAGVLLYLSMNTRPHCLCSQPSSSVHFHSQAVPCISCQDDHQVPLCNLRLRHHLYPYHCLQG